MFQFRGPDDLLLAGLAVVCAITDLRRHRIYDFVTMPAIAAGLAFALAQGPGEAALAAAGAAAGALVLYPGYRIGAVGDGDLKMLAAVGAIGGPILLGSAMVFSTLSGGLYSIVRTAMAGQDQKRAMTTALPILPGRVTTPCASNAFQAFPFTVTDLIFLPCGWRKQMWASLGGLRLGSVTSATILPLETCEVIFTLIGPK